MQSALEREEGMCWKEVACRKEGYQERYPLIVLEDGEVERMDQWLMVK